MFLTLNYFILFFILLLTIFLNARDLSWGLPGGMLAAGIDWHIIHQKQLNDVPKYLFISYVKKILL